MIILKCENFAFMAKAKDVYDELTKLGVPEYEGIDSPLCRYIKYLSDEIGVKYEQPCNRIVLDVLMEKCGNKLIWQLA